MREDGIGVYPTETFMALGCRAGSETAVARLYSMKQRPRHLPLPLIAADRSQVEDVASIPKQAEALMKRFWPGPLSIVLPASKRLPALLSSGTGHVAVRISPHPGAHALALAVGEALVSTSANISGAPPAQDTENLDPALLKRVSAVWNVPPRPAGGLPSTLVRLLDENTIHILRQGAIDRQSLEQAGFVVAVA